MMLKSNEPDKLSKLNENPRVARESHLGDSDSNAVEERVQYVLVFSGVQTKGLMRVNSSKSSLKSSTSTRDIGFRALVDNGIV